MSNVNNTANKCSPTLVTVWCSSFLTGIYLHRMVLLILIVSYC